MAVSIIFLTLSLLIYASAARIIYFGKSIDTVIEIIKKDEISNCYTEESINLSGLNIQEIPGVLIQSKNIQSISFENNFLKEIPSNAFDYVENLKCLNLGNNTIPMENLFNFGHANLQTLILRNQKEDEIEMSNDLPMINYKNWFYNMSKSSFPNLERLDLSGVRFIELPIYFDRIFPRLTHLYLTNTGFTHIYKEMFAKFSESLKSLHLEGNELQNIEFQGIINLEALYLDRNPLTNMSQITGVNLKTLSLSDCSMTTVYPEILKSMTNLVNLDLSKNYIREIPADVFRYTPNLENLSLSRNQLLKVPDLSHLTKLEALSLSYNFITDLTFEEPIMSVKKLSLRGNKLNSMMNFSIGAFPMLQELDLAENELENLPYGWTFEIPHLTYLNLESNKFSSIRDLSLYSSPYLQQLFVKGNFIKSVDENSIKSIPEMCVMYVR